MSIDNQEPDEPEHEPDSFITGRVFMTSRGSFYLPASVLLTGLSMVKELHSGIRACWL